MALSAPAATTGPIWRRSAWVLVSAGAMLAWFLQLLVAYALVPWSCRIGTALPLHIVTVVAAIGVVVSGAAAWRLSRQIGVDRVGPALLDQRDVPAAGADRPSSVGPTLIALALTGYSLYLVLLTGLVPVLVHECA